MKNIKKTARIFLMVFLLVAALFCFFKFFQYMNTGVVEDIHNFNRPKILYGSEQCYIYEDYIYVVGAETGTIHIFDKNGSFLTGYQLPTNGGAVWFGLGNGLGAYGVRKELLVKINGTDIISQEDIHYNSPEVFYDTLRLSKNTQKIKRNKVYVRDSGKEILLDIQTSVLPIYVYNILGIVFILAYVFMARPQLRRKKQIFLYRRRDDKYS